MSRFVAPLLLLGLVVGAAFAQDSLTEATEAWRRGDLPRAATLFAAAAETERDPVRRADIRVKLAWTYFVMRNRSRAEAALEAALADQPQLELVPDYYTQDFLELFAKAKKTVAPAPGADHATRAGTVASPTLASLRQRLAQAIDFAAVDAILGEVQRLEQDTPPAQVPELLELKAEVLERLGKGEESLEQRGRVAALRAIAQAPAGTSPWPLDTLLEGRRLLANGLAVESAAVMRGVLRELPTCGPALEVLGEALLAAGRYDQAYSALQTALFNNETPDLMMSLGEVELRRSRPENARNLFRRAAESDPGNDRAWASLGLLAARLADLGTSRDALDHALQANGTLFEARVVRAQIALLDGDAAGAVQHLQRALQVRPDDPWASGWLGVAQLANGNLGAAEPALMKGYQALPETFSLAAAELRRRRGDAVGSLEQLSSPTDPDDVPAHFLRARCLIDTGRAQEALGLLETLAAKRPEDPRITYLLGFAEHAVRAWGAAVAALDRARVLTGSTQQAAQALENAKSTAAAQELMDGALTIPRPTPSR